MMRATSLRPRLMVLLVPCMFVGACEGGGGSGDTGNDNGEGAYIGSWSRASLTVDGSPETFCNAQIDLTATTWHSFTTGGGAMFCDCDITGTMTVDETTMVWTTTAVSGQYCGVWASGDTISNAWTVAGDTLTLAASNVVETYARIGGGGDSGGQSGDDSGDDSGGPGSQSCDRKSTFGACSDFTGTGWSEEDKAAFCTMGTLQTVACDDTNSVGACLIDAGSATEYLMTFYSDGMPPFQAAGAEQNCNSLGGTWMP